MQIYFHNTTIMKGHLAFVRARSLKHDHYAYGVKILPFALGLKQILTVFVGVDYRQYHVLVVHIHVA